jgi:hypothetical protein
MKRIVLLSFAVLLATHAAADEFWSWWGDGKAELSGYRLTQPRYGAKRDGTVVMVYVTEDMSDTLRVKADPGKHPKSDVFPVMKLNSIRAFQTGIYDYHVMTSTFARVAPGWPLAKLSFSSQEWCGLVYHQLLPRGDRVAGLLHSYFDGEADGKDELALPKDGVFEDALPILLRGLGVPYLKPGETRTVPFLPSLLRARLEHHPLAWARARITRAARADAIVTIPAGKFVADTWTVAIEGGPTLTLQFAAAVPHALLRWAADTGEEAVMLKSTRLSYWKLNGVGDEKYLKELGLAVPRK